MTGVLERHGEGVKEKLKYFLFQKALDYKRCFLQNMCYEDGRLIAVTEQKEQKSFLISRVLDSQETDMEWHRMLINLCNQNDTVYDITIYAANSIERTIDNRDSTLENVIFDRKMDIAEKKKIFRPYVQKAIQNTEDILLHDIKGRYLWFLVEADLQMKQEMEINKIQIFFPRRSWISYLPEVYQSEDKTMFLERFLAIYQTMHEELNEQIKQIPYLLDVDNANQEFLLWLSKWLDISESYVWSKEQLRELLKNATRLYKIRGTCQAVKEFIMLYTNGVEPFIVENFQIEQYKNKQNKELLERLYGNHPYQFQVIVKEENIPTIREYQTLVKIIEEVKPAYMEMQLIVLKPYIFLDQHTYIGINSVLGEYRNLALDGASMLSFSVLGNPDTVLK